MKNKRLDELFLSWEHSNPEYIGAFKKDGIIDELEYSKQEKKILFIAKEPNEPDQTPGDNREWFLGDKTNYSFCYRIYEWAYGIIHGFPKISEIEDYNAGRINLFRKIAFMNLKKNGGGGVSNYAKLKQAVINERDFIVEQIAIIRPDVIVGCINSKEIWQTLFPDIHFMENGYEIGFAKIDSFKIIDYYHPSFRAPRSMSYCLLQTVMQSNEFMQL